MCRFHVEAGALCLLFVILLWTLSICGDIELNPGPAKGLCVLHSKPIKLNQEMNFVLN